MIKLPVLERDLPFSMRNLLRAVLLASLILMSLRPALANEPPRPGEIANLKQTGEYAERLQRAIELGNHRVDEGLLAEALYKVRRAADAVNAADEVSA